MRPNIPVPFAINPTRKGLTAVRAAAEVSRATVEGAAIGSRQIVFAPRSVRSGDYRFSIGTAGSTTLVFQSILPALLCAEGTSTLAFEGGTHNPKAPPFEFIERTYVPLVNRMGPTVQVQLERRGFYPAGGGRFTAVVQPATRLHGIDLGERGRVRDRRALAIVSRLPRHIAERELQVVAHKMGWKARELHIEESTDAHGPGNALLLAVECEYVTEVFSAIGEIGVPAETVAGRAVRECRQYLDAGVPVGAHLADQLLLPLAIAGAGSFVTESLTLHATTHIELIRQFLPVDVQVDTNAEGASLVRLTSAAAPSIRDTRPSSEASG